MNVRRNFSEGATSTFFLSFSVCQRCNASGHWRNALPILQNKQNAPCYGNSHKNVLRWLLAATGRYITIIHTKSGATMAWGLPPYVAYPGAAWGLLRRQFPWCEAALRSRSRKESEVFGWIRSRIPNNTGSQSRIFLSDSGCPIGSFFHHTSKLRIPVERVQFLLKLLLKQRFLAVHHDFHWF